MKYKFYYILVIFIVLNNIFLLSKNSSLKTKLENLSTNEAFYQSSDYVENVHMLLNSKYINHILDISILDNILTVKLYVNKDMNINDILDDTQNILQKDVSSIDLRDDENLILTFTY